jgi:hypothetical protein
VLGKHPASAADHLLQVRRRRRPGRRRGPPGAAECAKIRAGPDRPVVESLQRHGEHRVNALIFLCDLGVSVVYPGRKTTINWICREQLKSSSSVAA